MARTHIVASIGFSIFALAGLSGCVSQEKYNAQKLRGDQLAEQLNSAQAQASTEKGQADILRQQLERIRNSGDNRDALLVNQAATIADLQRQLDEFNARYNQAIANAGKMAGGPLPQPLVNVLTEFAAKNPDLVDFDSSRGLVKFKSDVTFSTGSAEVQPGARNAIAQFAAILNTPAAGTYDLMVVGHTDSQPVSNPATVRAGHLDNWYLSAHRAISVSKELQKQNVSASRIQVAGYADQRPIDPGKSKEAWAKNRRVEVLILPTQGHPVAQAPAPAAPAAPAPGQPAPTRINKDVPVGGGTADIEIHRPAANK